MSSPPNEHTTWKTLNLIPLGTGGWALLSTHPTPPEKQPPPLAGPDPRCPAARRPAPPEPRRPARLRPRASRRARRPVPRRPSPVPPLAASPAQCRAAPPPELPLAASPACACWLLRRHAPPEDGGLEARAAEPHRRRPVQPRRPGAAPPEQPLAGPSLLCVGHPMPRRRVFASISFRGPWKFLPSITGATEKKRKRGNIDVSTNKKPRVGTIDQKEAKRWPEAVVLPNVPMPIIWGTRSHQDGSPWTCTNCGNVNQPTRHLLVDLPAFNCVNCGKPSRVDFRFSFSNLAANGTCPVGKIKDQENTDLCAAFAVTMSVEISVRMRAVLSGVCPRRWPQLDPYCLLEFYIHTMEETPVSYEDIDFTSGSTLVQYARLATTTGIYDKDHENVYKATDIEFVGSDFETVCKHLANGFPLVTSIVTGDGFDDLNYSQIYKTRTLENLPEGHNVISHVVVLVGAGRSGTRDFYYFVNSYGEEFCLRGSDLKGDKIGGVGKIRASDIFALSIRFIR